MPLGGTSVYIHASSTLASARAGSSISITGRDDVEIQGAVLAGAVRGSEQDRRNQRYDQARGVYCYPEGDCYYPDGRRYR